MSLEKNKDKLDSSELRHLAEEKLRKKMTEPLQLVTEEALQRIVHELKVHQIELEMQNLELREARNKLEASLEMYTDLYDFAPVGYITIDSEGKILAANLTVAILLGIERAQLLGQNLKHFVAAQERSAFINFLGTLFSSLSNESFEVTLHNMGKLPLVVQIVLIKASAVTSRQECLLALIDITRRKQAEDSLREKENQMLSLAEMSIDSIVMLDENGMITFCNAAVERMFGCSTAEILGRDFHNFLIPQRYISDAKRGFESFKEHGKGKLIGRTTEVVALRTDGTELPIELSVSALNIKGMWHAIAIMRDVTERKLAEVRISEVIRQQQAILDNIPNNAWLKDRAGRYVAVNEPFSKAFDMLPNDLVGKTDYDIYPPKLAKKYDKEFNDVIENGTRRYFEESVFDREGNLQHLEKISTPIFNESGTIIGIIGISHDFTIRKEVEVKLRHSSTHDILTGLYNRAFFDEELDRLAHSRMFPLCIVMADVNGLKIVNDTQGHAAGDLLIRLAAKIIKTAFRAEDLVFRIGGDEFAVLLPVTNMSMAEEAVERIMNCPEFLAGQVSVAFGIALAESNDQLAEAIKLSDQLMYQHKSSQKES